MHDMLFTHQDRLEEEDLLEYADAIGLDLHRFDREMKAHVHREEVKQISAGESETASTGHRPSSSIASATTGPETTNR